MQTLFLRRMNPMIASTERVKRSAESNADYVLIQTKAQMESLIEAEVGEDALAFIKKHIPVIDEKVFVAATSTRFNIVKLPAATYDHLLNLKRVNDFRYVNKFFEAVNQKLDQGGLFIDFVDTYATRRKRILKKFIPPFNWFYYLADVLFFRVSPKLPLLKKVYFFLTKGKNRVLTRAETFGRLYSCGFEVVDEGIFNNKVFFVARKIKEPVYDMQPTYGLIARLKRVGKNGKVFNVYKLRTMHPYSEYLQDYIYKHHRLQEGGKFKNDFRVSREGAFFRKFWLDELPMFLNLLKGDMKLVGVRPLSQHYFNLYTPELQEKRTKTKPGLLPPFYAGKKPKTLEDIMASEWKYLKAYEKHPFRTDVRYFFMIFWNIVFRGRRSK
jgi:lipopolysaccharide/colanic/teichoic acid biosynthesis glycosyltransferase